MKRILESLNSEQRNAVMDTAKYMQIVAGPGTGKTTTLAAKMLYAQTEIGISTENILGISFSKSAKAHLLKKLDEFIDHTGFGGMPTVRTFHSLAYQIIKLGIRYDESHFRIGFQRIATEQFINLDSTLTKDLCTEYADRNMVNFALAQTYNLIRQGSLANRPITHWSLIDKDLTFPIRTYDQGRIRIKARDLITYWKRISRIEKIKNITDYQGLISEAIYLLNLKKHTYEHISKSYPYIYVDEYQDTSLAQEELLFALINQNSSITVVGDKNQTIYTFNGSNSKNMDRFLVKCKKKSPLQTQIIKLTRNYRSTKEIIHVANEFMSENLTIAGNEKSGLPAEIIETHSMELAAEFIATKISELCRNSSIKFSDICVLYRKNSDFSPQADLVYKYLKNHSVPFNIVQNENSTESLVSKVLAIQSKYEDELLNEVIKKLKINEEELSDLITFIQDCIKQGAYEMDDLSEYLVELEEEDSTLEIESDSVTVKTIHNAKGQEYPIVFILYLGDRKFPHSSRPDIEEEKRLLYVALTRAKNQLYVLGEKGIEFESFLEKCHVPGTKYLSYHSSLKEEKNSGFSDEDKALINETTKQLEREEKKIQEELLKLMDLF